MKFSSISANRSLAIALLLGGTLAFSMSGITHAQYGTSGQGGSTGQGSGTTSSGGATSGTGKDGKDSGGSVDQKKRAERAKDGASPSNDPHVPDVSLGKDGKPTVNPSQEQGGSIGPN
ncbi:MAG: hypothetical protein ABIV42_02425 [Nitrosospira sp.]